jgi:hypothetical protein
VSLDVSIRAASLQLQDVRRSTVFLKRANKSIMEKIGKGTAQNTFRRAACCVFFPIEE